MPFLGTETAFLALVGVGGPAAKDGRDFRGSDRDGICEGLPGLRARLDDPRHVLQLQAGRRQLWRALTQHIGSDLGQRPSHHFSRLRFGG